MLQTTGAFSSFSVNDLSAARKFYKDLLGLDLKEQNYMLELTVPRAGSIIIYPKEDHQPATFTVLNFHVEDIEKAVSGLESLGVPFESYDLPGLKTDPDHIFRDTEMQMKIAWFTDPAGNILSLIEEAHLNA